MTPTREFWNWFIRHEPELFGFEAEDQERIFDQIEVELQTIDPDLTFEFGPREATREFVISAGGIRSAFPAVQALVNAAPPLDRWRVTAFRPRRPASVVEFSGKRVDPDDVQFTLLDNGKTAGINLFIPGFQEESADLKQIGYLLLDTTLGEYDVETRLGLIEMFPPEAHTEGVRRPLIQLPELFDKLIARLERR